jgi:WD40 repeat protein
LKIAIAALGMSDNSLKIWDWSTNTVLWNLNWFSKGTTYIHYNEMKFLSNGLLVASYSSSTMNVWNVTTGQVRFSLSGSVYALEQLSNGNLISSGTDNYFRIWNAQTGQLVYQLLDASTHFSLKQTLTPNLLASGCLDRNIYIWDISSLRKVFTLSGHVDQVYFLDLIPTGLLISGSLDYTVKLWNMTQTSSPLSSIIFPNAINCLKVVSKSQLVVGLTANYIQFVNINASNVLSLGIKVNLIANTYVYDMRVTMENILLLSQVDGSVFFLNLNTSTFKQALLPSTSVAAFSLDLIGESSYFSFLRVILFKK